MSKYIFEKSRNPLLVKDDVGRGKPSCYDLPKSGDFTYGSAQGTDLEGAAEITRTWATHVPSSQKTSSRVNYIAFNKSLGRAKLSDCRPATSGRSRKKEPSHPQSQSSSDNKGGNSHAFGKSTRASTPIGCVIGNQFAVEFEQRMDVKAKAAAQEIMGRTQRRVICTTRAAEGHKIGADKRRTAIETGGSASDDKPHFKLSKFANVKSTFTLPNAKKKAGSQGQRSATDTNVTENLSKANASAAEMVERLVNNNGDISPSCGGDISP